MILSTLLQKHATIFAPVVPFDWQKDNTLVLDFTAQNTELEQIDLTNTSVFSQYVFNKISQAGAVVGVGGYNEHRWIYRRSEHFQQTEDPRCIHLGIDIWAAAGTPVFAPLAGKVHSFQHNDNFGDYGPTIIVEHELEGTKFYTLYGHLSLESLTGKYMGMSVQAGEQIANFGNYPINGDWPPHLHFQVMSDMLGLAGDFPGVCSLTDRAKFLEICPDPNLILGIPQLVTNT